MPRQQQSRARSSRAPRARASSAERHQKVSGEVSATTTTEAEQQGRLRRVRSFTMRSGAVVNRGDSFKIRGTRGGDDQVELTSRRRYDPHGVVDVDDEMRQRSYSAATTSRRRLAQDDDDFTDPVVKDGNGMTSADKSYTVMVLGSEGVGKTTVTQQLLTSEYLANKHYNVG